ncbi:glycosyltransferase [Streptomyces sp. NPDC058469]|uniref:glycosyltransferase n=1 Tax=Streptomyces sp. NPDC058469 TaxID=3346514 RepID=UPI003654C2EC
MLEPRLVVLIPAHNEADRIGAAIEGLWRQTRKPDLIVVVTDNCTDHAGGGGPGALQAGAAPAPPLSLSVPTGPCRALSVPRH